ncbi:hypothetical protein C6A88_03525 [Mycolicibacterium austroafricanum]|nr:hypothetical protein C6A88_03525 [Mycolicibacterium austroafricanum]
MRQHDLVTLGGTACPRGSHAVTVHEDVDDETRVPAYIPSNGVGPARRGPLPAEIDSDSGVGTIRQVQPLHIGHIESDSREIRAERT